MSSPTRPMRQQKPLASASHGSKLTKPACDDLALSCRALWPLDDPVGLPYWAMMGPVSYRGVLTIRATPIGLLLSVMVLFRLGHPPLLIPWHAIHRQGVPTGFLTKWLSLDLGEPKCTTLRIPAKQVDEEVLARYLRI